MIESKIYIAMSDFLTTIKKYSKDPEWHNSPTYLELKYMFVGCLEFYEECERTPEVDAAFSRFQREAFDLAESLLVVEAIKDGSSKGVLFSRANKRRIAIQQFFRMTSGEVARTAESVEISQLLARLKHRRAA